MTDFWQDSPELESILDKVAAAMEESVRGAAFPLEAAVMDIVASNGKMLRPACLIIGSRFGKPGAENRIIPLAAAVELLHVSTLIHDDIIDEAPMRRGLPTIHARFGTKEAVLAGDWLFSRCFRLAADSAGPDNAKALARLIGAICAAEIRQDLDKWTYSTSIRACLRTIAGKTAALFALSLHIGATEAKAPASIAERLRRVGYDIGMAFQIIDDILDFESSQDVMRKPVGRDIAEGLCTLPLIHAMKADEASMRSLLARVPRSPAKTVGSDRDAAIAAVLSRTSELEGVAAARKDALRFTRRAQAEIDRLPKNAARDELSKLTDRLLSRRY